MRFFTILNSPQVECSPMSNLINSVCSWWSFQGSVWVKILIFMFSSSFRNDIEGEPCVDRRNNFHCFSACSTHWESEKIFHLFISSSLSNFLHVISISIWSWYFLRTKEKLESFSPLSPQIHHFGHVLCFGIKHFSQSGKFSEIFRSNCSFSGTQTQLNQPHRRLRNK